MNNLLPIFKKKMITVFLNKQKKSKGSRDQNNDLNEEHLEDWFQSDACLSGFQYLTDEDIVTNCVVKSNSNDSTDAEDVANGGNTISHSAALQSVET